MLRVTDALSETAPVNMDMDVLLGKPPRMHRRVTSLESHGQPLLLDEIELSDAVHRVLRLPSVADKTFLISIGDRSVGGLTVRDQFVGPWQVPVADCAVTLMGFDTLLGEAMAIGERTPIAVLDAPASGRMAVGEAITNIAAADVGSIGDIKLSANWMAAVGQPGDDAALYRTVEAVGMSLCPALGIGIPVGKDSLSMRTAWTENGTQKAVAAPVSLIVSAFGVVGDVSLTLTPQISGEPDTELVLIDLGDARARMGGSALAQVYSVTGTEPPDLDDPRLLKSFFAAVRELARARLVLAYHDRSDGGLLACVAEMMFASRCGVSLNLDALVFRSGEADTDDFDVSARSRKLGDHAATLGALFNEELGAVIEIRRSARKQVMEVLRAAGLGRLSHVVGYPIAKEELRVIRRAESVFVISREDLQASWSHVSHQIQSRRDNPATASEENARIYGRRDSTQLAARLSFDATEDVAAPYIGKSSKPRVAILREQGVNGQIEMAHAFVRAGFDAQDVHMSDIIAGRTRLDVFVGLAACGGFSYGDVLGAGEGWAKSALFNPRARDQFSTFFARMDTFALGLCNGCQMLSNLAELIPGADNWPHFERNRSEQYEARTISLEILDSPSILFAGMAGSLIPLPTAHGEGRAVFRDAAHEAASRWLCAARFVDGDGAVAESFPANPNGSPLGMTAFTTPDGRFNIMMPHPERAVLNLNLSWRPATWSATQDGRPAFSPWMRLFRNARKWVG
jgi:phosphoribosylformylglycinamidine synthase